MATDVNRENETKEDEGMPCTSEPNYLDECIWRERHGQTKLIAFLNLVLHISEHCPV